MPPPYTIAQTAKASGLSARYIRRLRSAVPALFESHTERGKSNTLLFSEEMVEILKRTKDLKGRGRTLQQIRDEMMGLKEHRKDGDAKEGSAGSPLTHTPAAPHAKPGGRRGGAAIAGEKHDREESLPLTDVLKRENTMLRSQVTMLQGLLDRAEARFDRLLPEARETREKREKREGLKAQLTMWLVEAVVVTSFAAGFIFLIWLFAQKAFSL